MILQKTRLFLLILAVLPILHGNLDPLWAAAPTSIQTIQLEMDPKDAQVIFRKEPTDDSTFPVTVLDQGQRLTGRIETTGKTTSHFLKKSLLIKLKKGGPKWQGHDKISLKSMSTDISFMREWLAWDLFSSLGMVAPKVEHIRLEINNQFIGIFLFIEWITPSMIDRFGYGKDGEFFHPNDSVYCADMTLLNQPRLSECFFKLSPRNTDYTPLYNLIEEINKTPVAEFDRLLDQHFYADSMINWLALNTIIGGGDTYNKNYFIYQSKPTSKWLIIPWDFDLSFGRNSDPALPFPRNVLNDNYQYFYPPELGANNPLKEKTLRNPELLRRFRQRLSHLLGIVPEPSAASALLQQEKAAGGFAWFRKLFGWLWGADHVSQVAITPAGGFGWFHPDQFNARITLLEEIIRPDLARELYPGVKGPPFDQQVAALRHYNQWRYHLLKKTILEPSPFNTAHWMPYTAYPPWTPVDPTAPPRRQIVPLFLTATAEIQLGNPPVVLMEEFMSRPIGILDIQSLNRPARIRLEVETEDVPEVLPPGVLASKCIERKWYLDLKTPDTVLTVNLQLDYLQENSLRHEIGEGVTNENALMLWAYQNRAWQPLQTVVNPIVNILTVEGVQLTSDHALYFVACEK